MLDPSLNGTVIRDMATFLQQLFQIAITQRIGLIAAYSL